jgi:hypothetical protein
MTFRRIRGYPTVSKESILRVMGAPVAVAGDFAVYGAATGLVLRRLFAHDRDLNSSELAACMPSS